MTEADFARWAAQWRTPPAPIVPVPAVNVIASGGTLRGARVLIGVPGHGWRDGMRADAVVKQGARTMVPVLAESEWYRAERDRTEVAAALVPIERVWVETIHTAALETSTAASGAPALVSLDGPPHRPAVAAEGVAQLTGRRMVHTGEDGETRGLRAVTEAHEGEDGMPWVRVVAEADWYAWAATGKAPATRALPVSELWLE
ncbi:hypothetical protein [Allorhizocola rhizosphaerae]|uniref:hypothetical protein n=1 Tax=Allorhizocola rhizosphaerae TaxID=1872709 RepID=UPI000E3B5BC7|nr:hypothetical protein [Allorhizocola rhizosphaerae]